jgi:LAO/AO transport system kinase
MSDGSVAELARLISSIERREEDVFSKLESMFEESDRAPVLGVTGPPGVGKSTLVDELIEQYRERDLRVAVVAVDPSSPYSGGAILGDRVRMQRHSEDPDVYIRSMSTRGHLGGLNSSIYDVVIGLSHYDFDLVILETVGVGQGEVEISRCSDYTALVMVPAYGDTIQLIKAGIQEIADCFVINKTDQYEPDQLEADLHKMSEDPGQLEIFPVSGQTGEGMEELADHLLDVVRTRSDDDEHRGRVTHHHLEGLLREEIEDWVHETMSSVDTEHSNPYRRRREFTEEWEQ